MAKRYTIRPLGCVEWTETDSLTEAWTALRECEDRISNTKIVLLDNETGRDLTDPEYLNCDDEELSEPQLTDDMIRELCFMTTRDEAGRHFTERSAHYDELEQLGLIEISRPVHDATGIAYDSEYWSVEVTEQGMDVVEDNPRLHPWSI